MCDKKFDKSYRFHEMFGWKYILEKMNFKSRDWTWAEIMCSIVRVEFKETS